MDIPSIPMPTCPHIQNKQCDNNLKIFMSQSLSQTHMLFSILDCDCRSSHFLLNYYVRMTVLLRHNVVQMKVFTFYMEYYFTSVTNKNFTFKVRLHWIYSRHVLISFYSFCNWYHHGKSVSRWTRSVLSKRGCYSNNMNHRRETWHLQMLIPLTECVYLKLMCWNMP